MIRQLIRASSLLLLVVLIGVRPAVAYPSLFTSRCASCHTDDTPTCNGCHFHRGGLSARASLDEVPPGDPFTITLDGGSQSGWIRGLLYDQDDNLVAELGGPTGTGDDGAGAAVTFPVTFQAVAPLDAGEYTWQAAYFGGDTSGSGHSELRVPVSFTVPETVTSIPEWPLDPDGDARTDWSAIKALY